MIKYIYTLYKFIGYTTEQIFIEIKTKTTGKCRPHTLLMRASLHDITLVIFKQSYLRVSCHSIDHRLSTFTSLIGR